jgi:hypothetical protein
MQLTGACILPIRVDFKPGYGRSDLASTVLLFCMDVIEECRSRERRARPKGARSWIATHCFRQGLCQADRKAGIILRLRNFFVYLRE